MTKKPKRRKGGQPGNQNARRHGFYSSSLNQAEICRLLNIINLEGVNPVVAVMRLKLSSVLERSPGNRRVILEACKILAEYYASNFTKPIERTLTIKYPKLTKRINLDF